MTPSDSSPLHDSPVRSITIEIPAPVALKLSETFDGTLEDAARAGLKLLTGMGPAAYNDLLHLAKQTEASPAKVLRSALKSLADELTRRHVTTKPVTVGRPRINEERDAKLYARIKSGVTQAQAASEFNLSIVRVGQIVARHRILNGDAPRGHVAPKHRAQANPNLQPTPFMSATAPEVLTLKESTTAAPDTPTPTQPRKLAVIPPSMKNPELFRKPEDRPQPVPVDQLNMDIFRDDLTLDEAIGLLDEPKGE